MQEIFPKEKGYWIEFPPFEHDINLGVLGMG